MSYIRLISIYLMCSKGRTDAKNLSQWQVTELSVAKHFCTSQFLVTHINFGQRIMSFPCVCLSVTCQTNACSYEWFTSPFPS